jgi:asparagine synthase (glutamine-hydrolysing)
LDIFEKCTGIIEEPLATTSVIPMFYLSKLASQYVKVILSGQGADESLGGYGRYKGELLNEIIPSAVVNLLKPLIRKLGIRKDNIIRGINSLGEKRDLPRFLNTYAVFSDEEILHLTGHQDTKSSARIKYFYDLLQCQMRKTSVERMMSLDLRLNLSDDLLLYTDKITMHHSIECRVPMLDLQLTRFIESLPSHYRVNLLKTKIIHKQFAKTELPQKIINRRKKGFLSPTNKWLKNDAIRDILCDPNTNFANNFSPIYVSKVFDEHKNGFNRERHIFLLLGIYYWMKSYL